MFISNAPLFLDMYIARLAEESTHLLAKPCGATSICHSVAFQTQVEGDVQAPSEQVA